MLRGSIYTMTLYTNNTGSRWVDRGKSMTLHEHILIDLYATVLETEGISLADVCRVADITSNGLRDLYDIATASEQAKQYESRQRFENEGSI